MVYPERLVRNFEEVIESTKSFNAGLDQDPRLRELLSDFRAWYYIPEIDAVGPSKFIGYRDMSADFYLAHTGKCAKKILPRSKRLDGGETEKMFRKMKWFERTERGTAEYEYISEMTKELLDRWGKKPRSNSRYCVPIGFRLAA